MISSMISTLSTSGIIPAPRPSIRVGFEGPPESTAETRGSTATTFTSGHSVFNTSPTPVSVPPVPTPVTKKSMSVPSALRISTAVVRR